MDWNANNGFRIVAGEGATLKHRQLEREICQLGDPTERANLQHTFSKLFMFLEEDIRGALKEAARQPYARHSR